MAEAHITPLSRNQLLDLESLVQSLVHTISHPCTPSSTPRTAATASGPLTSPASPAFPAFPSNNGDSGQPKPGRPTSLSLRALEGITPPTSAFVPASASAAALPANDHPALRGNFIDVFRDPFTRRAWRLHDKLLYLVWWSYMPPCCLKCGTQDAWVPSGDDEAKCAQCGAEAGSTRQNDVVEDFGGDGGDGDEGGGGGENSGDDENDYVSGGSGAVGGAGNPLAAYHVFYHWLQELPRLYGSTGKDRSAAGDVSMVLPKGEALPAVLRAAYDMAGLLIMPGMAPGAAYVARAAALYLSLVLHRFAIPFPLFTLAVRHRVVSPGTTSAGVGEGSSESPSYGGGTAASLSPSSTSSPSAAARTTTSSFFFHSNTATAGDTDLQWVDVELAAALLGVTLADFFESVQVAAQYLQNIMTVAAAYAVPSMLWHPSRVPGRAEAIMGMKQLRQSIVPQSYTAADPSSCSSPLPAAAGGGRRSGSVSARVGVATSSSSLTHAGIPNSTGLSPEHTAMIVAIELARRVDEQPITSSSTSAAAAAQNAQRLGQWLDGLGVYPQRRSVYRSSKDVSTHSDGGPIVVDVAAIEDPGILEALTTQDALARAHNSFSADTAIPSASSAVPNTRHRCGITALLPSPCANAVLHALAEAFHLAPLELLDLGLRSGIYRGNSYFLEALQRAAECGEYGTAMPLTRRLSPINSCWMSAYMALHSEDRLPLVSVLQQLGDMRNSSRDRYAALCRLLQRLMRRHQSSLCFQFNYVLRVVDDAEKHFNGLYFLSAVLGHEGLAVFTCLRSGRKTVTFNAHNGRISLCYLSSKERNVDGKFQVRFMAPVVAFIERETTKLVADTVVSSGGGGGIGGGGSAATTAEQWARVVRTLDGCARVRRRMRVPMLASRLDALTSIRDAATSARALNPTISAATLLGWGETETLLTAPPPMDALKLRTELQQNLLSLPSASLVFGFSENRAVALYATLVGLLEYVAVVMRREQQQQQQGPSTSRRKAEGTSPDSSYEGGSGGGEKRQRTFNWVEELLCEDGGGDFAGDFDHEDDFDDDIDSNGDDANDPYWRRNAARQGHSGTTSPPWMRSSRDGIATLTPKHQPFNNTRQPQHKRHSPVPQCSPPMRPALTPQIAPLAAPHTVATPVHRPANRPDPQGLPLPPPFQLEPTLGEGEASGRGNNSASKYQQRQQKLRQQQQAVMEQLAAKIPQYWEVLLGQASAWPLRSAAGFNSGGGSRSHASPRYRITTTSGGGNALAASSTSFSESSVSAAPFSLFASEECRRRLHNMVTFIAAYKTQREKLWEMAKAGTLTTGTGAGSSAPSARGGAAGREPEGKRQKRQQMRSGQEEDEDEDDMSGGGADEEERLQQQRRRRKGLNAKRLASKGTATTSPTGGGGSGGVKPHRSPRTSSGGGGLISKKGSADTAVVASIGDDGEAPDLVLPHAVVIATGVAASAATENRKRKRVSGRDSARQSTDGGAGGSGGEGNRDHEGHETVSSNEVSRKDRKTGTAAVVAEAKDKSREALEVKPWPLKKVDLSSDSSSSEDDEDASSSSSSDRSESDDGITRMRRNKKKGGRRRRRLEQRQSNKLSKYGKGDDHADGDYNEIDTTVVQQQQQAEGSPAVPRKGGSQLGNNALLPPASVSFSSSLQRSPRLSNPCVPLPGERNNNIVRSSSSGGGVDSQAAPSKTAASSLQTEDTKGTPPHATRSPQRKQQQTVQEGVLSIRRQPKQQRSTSSSSLSSSSSMSSSSSLTSDLFREEDSASDFEDDSVAQKQLQRRYQRVRRPSAKTGRASLRWNPKQQQGSASSSVLSGGNGNREGGIGGDVHDDDDDDMLDYDADEN